MAGCVYDCGTYPTPVCNPRALAWIAAVKVRVPSASFAGCGCCRCEILHSGGVSSSWSQHAWGNAVDFTGSAAATNAVGAFATKSKAFFGIENIIYPGADGRGGLHVDFAPNYTGTPPCAGGPAVSTSSNPNATSTPSNPCPPGQIPVPGPPGPTAGHGGGLPTRTTQCVDASIVGPVPGSGVFHDVTSAFGSVGSFLGRLPRYLEVGAGGLLMIVGLGVAVFAVSGRSNVVVQLAPKTLQGVTGALGGWRDARMERSLGGGGTQAPVDLGERRIEGYSKRGGLGTGEAA